MNYDQYTGVVRALAPILLGFLISKGLGADTAGLVVAAVGAVAAAVWSVLNNKSGKTIA